MNFETFMPRAAKVLFAMGWLLAIATLVAAIGFGTGGRNILAAVFVGLTAALNAAVIPWIGAALIWRADKFLGKPE